MFCGSWNSMNGTQYDRNMFKPAHTLIPLATDQSPEIGVNENID